MDKNAALRSSRPPSSASGSVTTVTMLRHPPYITRPSHEPPPPKSQAQTNVPPMNSVPRAPKSAQAPTSSASLRLKKQARDLAANSSRDASPNDDPAFVAARLNEFADFLVQFNNTTVLAIDSRLQKIETMLGTHLGRAEAAHRDHEAQYAMRLDVMSRSSREAVSDAVKQLFSEEERRAREESLTRNVSIAILSALQPRFDGLNRHMEENVMTTNSLRSSVRSVEERLKKLEDRAPSEITKPLEKQRSDASSASLQAKADGHITVTPQHLEEFGHMLDRLGRLVEGARDEAHDDKEDLVKHFDMAHHGFALTLHEELQTLKSGIGIGKGCLKDSMESTSSSAQSSIAEHLESISLDVQELFECFKDSEAAREEDPPPVKHTSEADSNILRTSHLSRTVCDAGVMTDDNQDLSAAIRGVVQVSGKHVDAVVQACASRETVDVMAYTESLPSTPESSDSSSMSVDGPVHESISAATLVDDGPFVPPCLGGNLIPVSSWTTPFPHQWPAPEPLPTTKLTLYTETREVSESAPSVSPALQLSGVPVDPSRSLLSPPPSSVSPSPSVILKRKADDVVQDGEVPESMDEYTDDSNTSIAIKQNEDDIAFDLAGTLSPLTPLNENIVIDLVRSPSPLTSLSSEAEDEECPESEENQTSGDEPRSSKSKSNPPVTCQEDVRSEQKVSNLLWCPHECGRVYQRREMLARHIRKSCPRFRRREDTNSRRAKRRKIDHDRTESSNSSASPGSKRRGQPRKTGNKAVTHIYPPEVLERCGWPSKARVNETFDHQFLQCDRCDSSYHYRCIGVAEDDRRLVPDAEFICPPCNYVTGNDPNAAAKKNNSSCCGRPDCDWPGEASDDNEDYFVVEKILGRSVSDTKSAAFSYLWLIKWSGYPLKECDWLEESGLPNADGLISAFYAAARQEGMKVRDDDSIYLLHEARKVLHLAVRKRWKWV